MDQSKVKYRISTTFFSAPLMLGAINVCQVCELAADGDLEILVHRQVCHEITKIISGNGVFSRNGREYPVEEGDLFLVKKGDMHYIRSSRENPLRFVCFAFNFNRESEEFKSLEPISVFFDELQEPIIKDSYEITDYVTAALKEINSKNAFSGEMIKYNLLSAIVCAFRCFNSSRESNETESGQYVNPLVYKITSYIDSHLFEIDNLFEISHALGYSYGYLSKQFSSIMDMTVMEYYTGRRLAQAVRLLREGKSVSETAILLKFSDTQSFCKAFKHFYNVPPKKYITQTR